MLSHFYSTLLVSYLAFSQFSALAVTARWATRRQVIFDDLRAELLAHKQHPDTPADEYSVLILGGGVTGVIAARQLAQAGIADFLIVEARDMLGGRLQSHTFGNRPVTEANPDGVEPEGGRPGYTIEKGANWVQGAGSSKGVINPIYHLVKKHDVKTSVNTWGDPTMYSAQGPPAFARACVGAALAYRGILADAGRRAHDNEVDLTARSAFGMVNWKPRTPEEQACEYYIFDWEFGQQPSQTSLLASSTANNLTYETEYGGFGGANLMSTDQRGFSQFLRAEALAFLEPSQVRYNSTAKRISYTSDGVAVTLKDGTEIRGKKALVTFSAGVLQGDDVHWSPELPSWKLEAIHSVSMGVLTKVFLQFPKKFWFDTQMALYAHPSTRGRFTVWQSLDHLGFFPGSGILFATVTGDYSAHLESLSDAEAQAEVLDALREMFPHVQIPEPAAFYFPRWLSDPLFRGSYSNWPASFYTQHQSNLRAPVGDVLWFAGEATSAKHFGYLHGAYYEGLDAGNALSRCITNRNCTYTASTPKLYNCPAELEL